MGFIAQIKQSGFDVTLFMILVIQTIFSPEFLLVIDCLRARERVGAAASPGIISEVCRPISTRARACPFVTAAVGAARLPFLEGGAQDAVGAGRKSLFPSAETQAEEKPVVGAFAWRLFLSSIWLKSLSRRKAPCCTSSVSVLFSGRRQRFNDHLLDVNASCFSLCWGGGRCHFTAIPSPFLRCSTITEAGPGPVSIEIIVVRSDILGPNGL